MYKLGRSIIFLHLPLPNMVCSMHNLNKIECKTRSDFYEKDQGWKNDSVVKVLAVQAKEPEFKSSALTQIIRRSKVEDLSSNPQCSHTNNQAQQRDL